MSAGFSPTIAGRARVAILVIVATLCVVPVLVRATFSGSARTPIRLNRGFERPPAKSTIAPPTAAAATPLSRHEAAPSTRDRFSPIPNDILPGSLLELAPDPLRGPPIPRFA